MQLPDRSLQLSGASNFRDLGGYAGDGGRTVRWRRLFRSDHLAALTPQDAEVFRGLGVTRVFDFRGVAERDAVPYLLPGVAQHALPIEPTVVQRMKDLIEAGRQVTPEHAVELMQHTYRAFAHDNAARFAALFEHLLDVDEPLVFHCTAGKDRTGFAAALILLALRLAVILCHARQEPEHARLQLRVDDEPARGFTLNWPEGWDAAWPQSAHLLREEAAAWQKTPWGLAVGPHRDS